MNEALVQMMDDSRLHRLEQRLDSDSVVQKLQHMEQTFDPQASKNRRRQRFSHLQESPIDNMNWSYTRNFAPSNIPQHRVIPIWWDDRALSPETVNIFCRLLSTSVTGSRYLGLPPLCTNGDFNNLTET